MAPVFSKVLAIAGLLSAVLAAPGSPVRRQEDDTSSTPVVQDGRELTLETAVGPAGAKGSLRGSTSLAGYNPSNSISSPNTDDQAGAFTLGPGQESDDDDADNIAIPINLDNVQNPQPIRGPPNNIPTDPGPRNFAIDRQNPDVFIPPGTDAGDAPNAKWPMSLGHNRHGLKGSGWARQQNVDVLPVATAMAGVDMRLEPNAYRELHWHKANEWAYIMTGTVRINLVNEAGETFADDLGPGDVWFFPAGIPHNIQAFDKGCEFLLVFDDGTFSEDNTFLVSELFERNPKSVLAKDLRVDTSAFDNIPDGELYIFDGTPAPAELDGPADPVGPAGKVPNNRGFSFHWSEQQAYEVPGGSVKVLDPLTFPTAANFAAALFTVKPGAMRELHWHTTSDEWSFILSGRARLTVFIAPESSRTFDFQAGDVGYVPVPDAHYIENTGDEDLVYLEVLQAGVFNDVSVAQWLGLTPKQVVADHLGFSEDTLNRLPQIKPYLLPGNKDLNTTDFREESE